MKIRILLILICASAFSVILPAQEQKNTLPDLYTAEQNFFDPTRKDEVKEEYKFSAPWRLEVGYAQLEHRTQDTTAVFMHGLRLGATVDFMLPHRFSIQTGALFTFTYGLNKQHWGSVLEEDAQVNLLKHNLLQLQLTIPVRAYYNIKVKKQFNIFFYAGPQLNIGLTHYDLLKTDVAPSVQDWLDQLGIATTPSERYLNDELYRTNLQFGLGAGMEWDRYRFQAGYDFGLNNIYKTPLISTDKMLEWGWMATFSYQL